MTDRITSFYTEGRSLGDLGYSNLLMGGQVSKGSAFGAVYSSIEWLQHGILKYLSKDNGGLLIRQLEAKDVLILNWLYQSLFGFSAFCYRKGNTKPEFGLLVPTEAYRALIDRIEYFKECEEAHTGQLAESEFIALTGTLNKLRLQARDVERNYVAWFNEPEIIKEYRTQPNVFDNLMRHQQFFNRLSSYFYWLTRHAALRDGNVKWTEWISRIPNFSI